MTNQKAHTSYVKHQKATSLALANRKETARDDQQKKEDLKEKIKFRSKMIFSFYLVNESRKKINRGAFFFRLLPRRRRHDCF